MTRVLLYSPHLNGHPQVYCRVIGDILLEQKAELIIATADIDDWAQKWPDLKPYQHRSDVMVISTVEQSKTGNEHLLAEELRDIQVQFDIDSTLLIEPEFFREQFVRIFNGHTKKLHGYNAGIFGGTTKWYPGEDFYSGEKIRPLRGGFRSKLGAIKRRYFEPWTFDRYFFKNILIKSHVLDAVIVKDERIFEKYGQQVFWLPEIYKVFNAADSGDGAVEYERLKPKLTAFASRFNADDLVIFFGAGAWYKGYDYFIQLLKDDETSAGIHAGAGIRHVPGKTFIGEPEANGNSLLNEGRLFETNGYVESQQFIEDVFKCARRFVSTHRLTVSSGTMLQALDHGLPVLVPDTGLVGHRASANKLGRTYRYGDTVDLARQWRAFKREATEPYQQNIASFMRRFDRSAVQKLFTSTLIDHARPTELSLG